MPFILAINIGIRDTEKMVLDTTMRHFITVISHGIKELDTTPGINWMHHVGDAIAVMESLIVDIFAILMSKFLTKISFGFFTCI